VLALLYVVVLASGFGYGTWTWLLSRHEASRVAPFALLVPPFGIGSAWIALGEAPNAAELAGAALVIAGLALSSGLMRLVLEPEGRLRPGGRALRRRAADELHAEGHA
jgi:O-acetylserine/cysteine efflux transporter